MHAIADGAWCAVCSCESAVPRTLFVDDEPIIRATLEKFLLKEGFEAAQAASGPQ